MKIITINDIAAVNLDFRDLFVPGFTDKYQRSARAEYNLHVNTTLQHMTEDFNQPFPLHFHVGGSGDTKLRCEDL